MSQLNGSKQSSMYVLTDAKEVGFQCYDRNRIYWVQRVRLPQHAEITLVTDKPHDHGVPYGRLKTRPMSPFVSPLFGCRLIPRILSSVIELIGQPIPFADYFGPETLVSKFHQTSSYTQSLTAFGIVPHDIKVQCVDHLVNLVIQSTSNDIRKAQDRLWLTIANNQILIPGDAFMRLIELIQLDLIKLTNKTEIHNGLQFKTGYVKDILEFVPEGLCEPGGIYLTVNQYESEWYNYGGHQMEYRRSAVVPKHVLVYLEYNFKLKVHEVILGDRVHITTPHVRCYPTLSSTTLSSSSTSSTSSSSRSSDIQSTPSRSSPMLLPWSSHMNSSSSHMHVDQGSSSSQFPSFTMTR
jgi:hypothetical protein